MLELQTQAAVVAAESTALLLAALAALAS